ncbi:ester cyclase [Methanomassiliicoccus luminyensis]|jgi:steroid delta-isomerase-like uncharacterized protein|uniref:ester cyclase n=2 Tax=Methanomassiliicoccus luminyensis TaxID=1080712 RepID=UPI0009DA8AF4|nr:ester cyclase [Methanomassiliicoccus luminyensis]
MAGQPPFMTAMHEGATVEEANKMMVLGLFRAFGKGDVSWINDFVSDDYVQHSILGPPPGKEGLKKFFAVLGTAFPDLRIDIQDITAEGDKVFLRARVTGTWNGEWNGKRPNGKSFDIVEFDELRIEDGKIAEHWDALDIVTMMRQLEIPID